MKTFEVTPRHKHNNKSADLGVCEGAFFSLFALDFSAFLCVVVKSGAQPPVALPLEATPGGSWVGGLDTPTKIGILQNGF